MVKQFSLPKSERLSGKQAISFLFETGQKIYVPPLRIIYQLMDGDDRAPAMAVSVPKRVFGKAVDRNLLKRRIREAYRLNKSMLTTCLNQEKISLKLVIQYQHREISSYQIIEEALVNGLSKLMDRLRDREDPNG